MKSLRKCIAGLLVFSIAWVGFSGPRICSAASHSAKSSNAPRTIHEPKINSMPEQDIPLTSTEEGEKKGANKWVWIGLGVLAVGGLALALGGGGGGDDGDNSNVDTNVDTGTGSFTGTW